MFLEALGPRLLTAFPSRGWGGVGVSLPQDCDTSHRQSPAGGVQESSQCSPQPLFKSPPEKRAQSLAQFSIARLVFSIAWDRGLRQKDPSRPARESRGRVQGHPEAAELSSGPRALLWVLCCWPVWCAGGPCLVGSASSVGGRACLIVSLVASLWDSGAVTGVRSWVGREGRPQRAGPRGRTVLWIRPTVGVCAVLCPVGLGAGGWEVEERLCLEGGQLGPR